jgi:hypothetical protein
MPTPRTWRSLGKQRELRPWIREEHTHGRAYHDFTLFDRSGAADFDTYTDPALLLPASNAEETGNGDAGFNWNDYVSEEAWWLPLGQSL